jgi:hypothetical protein
MATKKAATKKAATKQSRPPEWPPRAVGSDALESLRDGNPPNALITFAINARGAGTHAWAIEFLRRGVDYLRYVMTSFPDVADKVQAQHDRLAHILMESAAVVGDESTLEFGLPPKSTPDRIGWWAEQLQRAKHSQLAVNWFVRARNMPMPDNERVAYMARYGAVELAARTRAKQEDVALAAEFQAFAEDALPKLDPSDRASGLHKRGLKQLIRAAQKVQAPADAEEAPENHR